MYPHRTVAHVFSFVLLASGTAWAQSSVVGQWQDPFVLDAGTAGHISPIHMAMLSNGNVLMWSRYVSSPGGGIPNDAVGTTPEAFEWNPTTGAMTAYPNGATNVFCAGHSQLSDGRLLIVGGHTDSNVGVADANTKTPGGSWTNIASMAYDRWYPSATTLPNGEVLVTGGSFGGDLNLGVRTIPEVFQTNGAWRQLTGAAGVTWFKYYPWNHVLSDGVLFYTGATHTTAYVTPSGTGSFIAGPPRQAVLRDYGTSVMYDQDKILVIGGGSPPQNTAGKIDVSPATRGTAAWLPSPMTYPRKLHNATILANGKVFVSGGTTLGGDPGAVAFEETGHGGPEILGNTTNKGLRIAVAPFLDRRLDVYMIGLDHVVWHRWQDASMVWHNWTPVGNLPADDIAVARLPNNTAEVMIVDHNAHNLWHINVPTSGVTSGNFIQLGSSVNVGRQVAIAPFSNGTLDFYMVGLDYQLWHLVGTSTSWINIGSGKTAWSGTPRPLVVTRRPDDSSEVVIIAADQTVWHDWIGSNGVDHGFQIIGDATNKANRIAVAPFQDGRLDVYMAGLDWRAWHIWQTAASSTGQVGGVWKLNPGNNFFPIGTDPVDDVAPVRLADGHADVFVILRHNQLVYHTNGDNFPVYATAHANVPPAPAHSGTYKRAFLLSNTTPDDSNTATQLIAVPYVSTLGGVRLDSRAAVVYLATNQNMFFNYQANGPVFAGELWSPSTSTWTTTGAMQVPRTYHSSTVLLRDGSVLSAGGGAGGAEPDHPNAEIYKPPYLFQGVSQPTVSAPTSVHYGVPFTITLSTPASNVRKVSLVGLSATTHSFNQGQHFNWLSFSGPAGNTLTVTPPANSNVAPPGYYMLFALLDQDVPSIAAMIRVGP